MIAPCFQRGHKIIFNQERFRWEYENGKEQDYKRACKRCGKKPLEVGHDACLGTITGAISACCGHGRKEDAYIKYSKETLKMRWLRYWEAEKAQWNYNYFKLKKLKMEAIIKIQTAYRFPDGDNFELFYDPKSETVSDLGETLRWIHTVKDFEFKMSGVKNLPAGVEVTEGVLSSKCKPGEIYTAARNRVTETALLILSKI